MEQLEINSEVNLEAKSSHSHNSGGTLTTQHSIANNVKDNVKVMIRVRPFNERENSKNYIVKCSNQYIIGSGGQKKCISIENQSTLVLESKPDYKVFNFDFVGDEDLEQKIIFNQIAKPIADYCLEGYNGSIFAYGQTGSGKTYTIQGPSSSVNGEESVAFTLQKDKPDYEKRGLMPRSFEYIFDCIEIAKKNAAQQHDHFEFLIRCTYLEIYNEQVMDLLEPGSYNLHIREDIKKGVYVEGLLEENVQNAHDMMELITRGAKNRHMGSTTMNKESSRSHSVLTTIIETKSQSSGGVWNIKTSRFHIIDLAGSERAKYTNAMGDRLKEAGMINKSLSALGNVINSLVDISEGKSRHVHYRDSKLTFLLRDSLGGNSKTVIIANISPSSLNYGETLSTLKFAQRAKLIRNKAVINEDSSGTIQLLKQEIGRLKKDLAESEQRSQSIGQQCAFCKNNIGTDYTNIENDIEDSMLIDSLPDETDEEKALSGGPLNETLKQKYVDSKQEQMKMRKRVIYLEGLLSANLDNLTSQQKFYELEIQKNQAQMKKFQQSVESYEKQCSRDKMIIKFREDRITKLEQNLPVTTDDNQKLINDMKKEISVWKESVEHNAQAAKLFAEKADLQSKHDTLQKELKQTPDSLSAQMRSLTELNESLNDYLKQYCEEGKKETENDLQKLKIEHNVIVEELKNKLDELKLRELDQQIKYQSDEQQWLESFASSKQEIERLNKEYLNEKEEIQRLNIDAFNQIKHELESISVNKSEQENTAARLKIEMFEKEKQFENEVDKLSQSIKQHQQNEKQQELLAQSQQAHTTQLQQQIENVEHQKKIQHDQLSLIIENERKQNITQLTQQSESWLKKLKEQEKEMLDAQNEKAIIEQQCDQMDTRIHTLQQENETIQESLIYKQEELQEIFRKIQDKQSLIIGLEEKVKLMREFIDTANVDHDQQIKNFMVQIETLKQEKQKLESDIIVIKQDNQELIQAVNEVKDEINLLMSEKRNLQENIIKHEQETASNLIMIEKIQDQNKQYVLEIAALKQNLQNVQELLQSEKDQSKIEYQLLKNLSDKQVFDLSSQIELLKDSFKIQQEELATLLRQEQTKYIDLKQVQKENIERFESTITKQKSDYQQNTEQILIKKTGEIEAIKLNYEQTIHYLKDQHIQQVAAVQVKLEEQIQVVTKQRETSIQDIIQKQTQLAEQKEQNHIVQQKELQAFFEQKVATIIEQQTEIQQTIESKLQESISIKLKIEKEYVAKVQKLEKESQKEIEIKVASINLEKQQQIEGIKSESNHEVQSLSADIQSQKKQIGGLQCELKQQEMTLNKIIESKQNELRQKAKEFDESQELLINQIRDQQQYAVQFSEQQSQLNTKMESVIEQLQIELTNKEQNINKQVHQINQIENELKSLNQQLVAVQLERDNLLENNEDLSQVVTTQKYQIYNITKQIKEEESQNVIINSQKDEIAKEKCNLYAQTQEIEHILKQNVLKLEVQVNEINHENTILNSQLSGIMTEKLGLCNQTLEFTFQVKTLEQGIKELSQQNMAQESHILLLEQQINENEEQIDTLQNQLQQLSNEIFIMTNKIQELNQEAQSYQNNQQTQNGVIKSQQIEFEKLAKQLQQAQGQKSFEEESKLELFELLNQKEQQIEQLNLDLEDINNERSQQEQENHEVMEAFKESQEHSVELGHEIDNLIQQKKQLQLDYDTFKYEQSQQENSNEDIVKQLTFELTQQIQLQQDSLQEQNIEHARKCQDLQKEHKLTVSQVKSEVEAYKHNCKELNTQLGKLKQRNEDQNDMLKSSKDTISEMVQKENDLMKELEKKINELKDHQDKWKKRVQDAKEEKDQLRKDWDRIRKENENLRELVKLKDRQIEDYLGNDDKDKEAEERILKENKDLRNQITKREFEMKEVVRTLKFYSEEKNRLEKELEKLHRENDQLIGHKNPSQKIQHHLKIKEENNKLREDNFKLLEEVRKKNEVILKAAKLNKDISPLQSQMSLGQLDSIDTFTGGSAAGNEDIRKLKKENMTYQETINRLVDHILSQSGLMKMLGLSDEMNEKIQQQNGTSKVKNVMEIVTLISNALQTKERELKELAREKNRIECKLEITEKEKNLCKSQLDLLQNNTSMNNSFLQNAPSFLPKSPHSFVQIQNTNEENHQFTQQSLNNQYKHSSQSKLQPDGLQQDKNKDENNGVRSKLTPPPLINFKQVKEKENINTKKEAFGGPRGSSSRRAAYLSNPNKQ